jgi:protein required for attachment to host cells
MGPGSDPIRRDMQDFALQTLGLLEVHLRARDFNRLAIFASPRMLGILREEMPTALHPAVILERDFNLIQMPGPELRRVVCLLLQSVPKTMPNARS